MISNPDVAFVLLAFCLLAIYAGFCGRVLLGVTGAVVAIAAIPSIGNVHLWVALTVGVPFALITVFLLNTAIRARSNKSA